MRAKVYITLKAGVLDPQGQAVRRALLGMGYAGIEEVRQGKFIEIDLAESDAAKARAEVERMCKDLLANPVIEAYRVEV